MTITLTSIHGARVSFNSNGPKTIQEMTNTISEALGSMKDVIISHNNLSVIIPIDFLSSSIVTIEPGHK